MSLKAKLGAAPETTALTKAESPKAIQRVYDSIPKDELREALEMSSDPRAAVLLTLLDDEAYANHKFALLCRNAKLKPEEVWKMITALHRLDGEMRLARRIPRVMEAMADEAMPQLIDCTKCKATGQVQAWKPDPKEPLADPPPMVDCVACEGQGRVLRKADTEKLKMTLEAAGVIGQRGPLIDARQVHMGGGRGNGGIPDIGVPDMSDWARDTDDAFEERGAYRKPQTAAAVPQPIEESEIVIPGDDDDNDGELEN